MLKILAVFVTLSSATPLFAANAVPPPPYQADLLRLSEVLGAAAYLDGLCGGPGAADWRSKMAALLDAQGLEGPTRRPYVEAFNRGQRTFAVAHRACTSSARSVLQRYFAEGAQLSDRLDQRFGRASDSTTPPIP
ncbi:TIGR02301 family protein [Pleomorphomonas sp. JP5]|uniref:TIGR02301 family protein n=1 Tax=Pleomorphomonas sp. JP5 TaxID=2942998 RepID=UPI0020430116|nr:TIGR02301 family protein [Pleomorphomonas sp. JP5]MCM5558775.1 TIGR02301 family protein [Pleomorphomonas sp. JP5]